MGKMLEIKMEKVAPIVAKKMFSTFLNDIRDWCITSINDNTGYGEIDVETLNHWYTKMSSVFGTVFMSLGKDGFFKMLKAELHRPYYRPIATNSGFVMMLKQFLDMNANLYNNSIIR